MIRSDIPLYLYYIYVYQFSKHPSKKCDICMVGMTILFFHIRITNKMIHISTYKVYNGRTDTVHTAAATRGWRSPRPAGRARRRP